MDDISSINKDKEFSKWFSTYGLITMERMLALLHLYPNLAEISAAAKDPDNIYQVLLRVPFKNILNSIILQQASDYREYGQKFFIHYLMSGTGNETEENPIQAGSARDRIEEERVSLISQGDEFDLLVFDHNRLIADSQKTLISIVREMKERYDSAFDYDKEKIIESMAIYEEKAFNLNQKLRQYRTQFYELIIRARDLADTIPEYYRDSKKLDENREFLLFDPNLGDESYVYTDRE